MATEALVLAGVDSYYGQSHILHGVSFTLGEGRLLGLLGRNGAGKTTCLSSIVGLVPARAGSIRVFGQSVEGMAPEQVAHTGAALVPQGRRIFKSLTVRENLTIASRDGRKVAAATLDSIFDMFPRLRERQRQTAGLLSGGEQQMLAIGRALMSNPRVLLMDEPTEGLAPLIVAEVMAIIRQLKERGLSILLVEQNARLVMGLADDIVILNSGRVVVSGTSADIVRDNIDLSQHLGVF